MNTLIKYINNVKFDQLANLTHFSFKYSKSLSSNLLSHNIIILCIESYLNFYN